jgi:hypothetical protein
VSTADLLTQYETCDRKGYWAQSWQRRRLTANQMLYRAIQAGVTETEREDFGVVAGETVMDLAADPGMEMPNSHYLHASVIHHAALADTLTSALRRPEDAAWLLPEPTTLRGAPWSSSAFLDPKGTKLRQVVLATSWSDARHYREIRSWRSIGEVAAYRLPMQMAILILGQHRDGRRSSPWTKGFLHPQNHGLRFRKKAKASSEVFSEKWEQVWREDRGEIDNRTWLQAMLADDILRDVCFKIELPVPAKSELGRIGDMAARKLDRLAKTKGLPEASLSVCDLPPCPFRGCCWSEVPYDPSPKTGFVRL